MLVRVMKFMLFAGVFMSISDEMPQIQRKEVEVVQRQQGYSCEWLGTFISQEDFELLCRTTFCEAGNQDFETQKMVCLTILNRVKSEKFPYTIHDVVYGRNAYEVTTWDDFESKEWAEQVEMAVISALNENNHPSDMFYFRTEHFHTFGKNYIKSDDLYFSLEGD